MIDARLFNFTIPTFPLTLSSFWSNLLPFTFNLTSDTDTGGGQVVLTLKNRGRRDVFKYFPFLSYNIH